MAMNAVNRYLNVSIKALPLPKINFVSWLLLSSNKAWDTKMKRRCC